MSVPGFVNSLRVVYHRRRPSGEPEVLPVSPDTITFDCVSAVVGLALDLLESRRSIRVLCSYTEEVALESPDIPRLRNLRHGEEIDLLTEFLAAIRGSTPHILLTEEYGMATKNGRISKRDCPEKFDPKRAAVIKMNENLVRRLTGACREATPDSFALGRFRTLLLRLSISFAHDIVHIYTLFLRRQRARHMPPRLTYGYGNDRTEEAGRFWEYNVFGGFVDMRSRSGEAIALRDNSSTYAWRMRGELIDQLVARRFSWLDEPLTSPRHDNARQAVKKMPAYTWKERWHDLFHGTPQRGPSQLSESQVQELVNLGGRAYPAYRVPRRDLLAFAWNPAIEVRVLPVAG